jgi:transposase
MEDQRMAMGKRDQDDQGNFWIPTSALPMSAAHPFYEQINRILDDQGFDSFVEGLCRKFYADKMGRPSLPPAIYFRLMLIGYFEGIDSERGIAWRVGDSLGLRRFLGYSLTDETPDHSTISRNRRLIDVETHEAVFVWVLKVLAENGLVKGKTIGIDATTLEANAAMRSIVRRETSESYQEFLTRLAKESGIETPTREDLARLDKKRKNKASNDDWENPHDPDARITKMKDSRTHLAHKAEHAVDMETGAIVAVTLQPADRGDTRSVGETLTVTADTMVELVADDKSAPHLSGQVMAEGVLDKGYHSNEVLTGAGQMVGRTYISEPDRGRRKWSGDLEARDAVYANRRRIRGARGKRLMKKRGELIERSFAHCYDTGGMRRTHLRKHNNILKRLLIHVAGFNLSLVMRKVFGLGTARGLQGLAARVLNALTGWWRCLQTLVRTVMTLGSIPQRLDVLMPAAA